MFIAPSTVIKFLKGVPLDTTYNHSLYFMNEQLQKQYFSSKAKYTYQFSTYQRAEKGKMRVEYLSDTLYDCNYMMFQNSSFGQKWFYAFITGVEYINDKVSEITYELDPLQTWYFNYKLKQCFIERQHTATDIVGDNIIGESIETGEYFVSDQGEIDNNLKELVTIISVVDIDTSRIGAAVDGALYDGIYSGSTYWVAQALNEIGINSKIEEYVQKPDAIVSIYMCPRSFISVPIPEGAVIKLPSGTRTMNSITTSPALTGNESFQGYVPKNKKLYTFPYNYVGVDNGSGNTLSLRYEFFENLTPVFGIFGTVVQPVKAVLRPLSYKGVPNVSGGTYSIYKQESLTMDCYPMCSWNTDAYKAWLAQNSIPVQLNAQSAIAGAAIAATTMVNPAVGLGMAAIGIVSGVVGQYYKASIQADISRGSINNGNVNCAHNHQVFTRSRIHVTKQYARVIDDFFSMYGYAINCVQTPRIDTREHWCYVKTVGCVAVGEMPAEDLKAICNIYDRGITFWKNGNEVGDYSLANGTYAG